VWITDYEVMVVLLAVTVPVLIISAAAAVMLCGPLSRTLRSPVAAGTLAALCGLLMTFALAAVLYAGRAVDY
jgi:threonine/homoserine/homoserine lactone efflux protein